MLAIDAICDSIMNIRGDGPALSELEYRYINFFIRMYGKWALVYLTGALLFHLLQEINARFFTRL